MNLTLTPAQDEIAKDRHRFRVVVAGRRFGKSTLAAWEMYAKAVNTSEGRITYIAPTFAQARDIVWMELKKICDQLQTNINESRLEITIKNIHGTTSLITLHGWESIETMRGQKYDMLILDEIANMKNYATLWQEVLRPALTDRQGHGLFIGTPRGFNHLYDLYNREMEDDSYKSFHFTSYDNPYLQADEIDKARKEISEDKFAQEYLAMFRKMEGLVYKEFNREKHLINPKDYHHTMFRELLVGIDFGFTNPCAVLSIYRDGSDCYYVMDEWYERGHTDEEVAEYVSALKAQKVYPDPESPAAIAELKKRKVNVRNVVKGKDSIKNGIDKVRELLKADKIKISTSCKNLIQELESYCYPDRKPDHNDQENPIDENNHACDSLRYVIMMTTSVSNGVAPQFRPNLSQPTSIQKVKGNETSTQAFQYRPTLKRRGMV